MPNAIKRKKDENGNRKKGKNRTVPNFCANFIAKSFSVIALSRLFSVRLAKRIREIFGFNVRASVCVCVCVCARLTAYIYHRHTWQND